MKTNLVIALAALLATAALWAATTELTVTHIDHAKVAESLAKGGSLLAEGAFTVSGSHRVAAGQVEVHEKETDIFYITDGEATFITGGTMVGGTTSAPGQLRGTDIQGGQSHHLVKGDVMVIPAGIPHWFREVPQSISYFVVKSLQP
jgi:mannose-6-phosphate isomerase-like protein (cupin superfamily)